MGPPRAGLPRVYRLRAHRFWATWHGPRGKEFTNGTLRFYLDGKSEPAIKGPIRSIIDQGALAPPPLSQGVSPKTPYKHRGHNLYLPIPYATHCKITYETDAPMLPKSLIEALAALRESTLYREALGDQFVDYIVTLKEAEIGRYLSDVTDWEHREYFDIF